MACFEVYRSLASGGIGDDFFDFLISISVSISCNDCCCLSSPATGQWFPYHVVKDTFVELPFCGSALPELLVIVVKAGPVFSEFCQAVLVHVLDPVKSSSASCLPHSSNVPKFLPSHIPWCPSSSWYPIQHLHKAPMQPYRLSSSSVTPP